MTVVRSIVFSEEKLRTKAVLFVGLVVLVEYWNLPPFWMEKFQCYINCTSKALMLGSESERVKMRRQWKLRQEILLTPSKKHPPRGTRQKFYTGRFRPEV